MSSSTERPGTLEWDEARAASWLAGAEIRERQLAPITEALFEVADLHPGEHVLDVGVGSGPTTAEAHAAVQPGGRVTGIDVLPAMIEAAKRTVPIAEIEWLVGDVSTYGFPAAAYDVVISRFGVMFFADPVAAFTRLHDAVRPGGRLAMATWGRREATGLFGVPYVIATTTLDRLGIDFVPMASDGTMFSLGDAGRVAEVLGAAGWREIGTRVDNRVVYLGGARTVESAADDVLRGGPVAGLLDGLPADAVAEVRQALVTDFTRRFDGNGVPLPAGFVLISAIRP